MRYLVHHLLESAAQQYPDRSAVIDGQRELTYYDLDTYANRLANSLQRLGIAVGDRVGIYLDKSLESVIAVYGILKAGAAYVPLDPEAPVSRLAYIASDCGITCLITGSEKQGSWDALVDAGAPFTSMIVLNDDHGSQPLQGIEVLDRGLINSLPGTPARAPTIDQDLAYILYTSGSTGDPKGVMLTHRNALAFIKWAAEEFAVGPGDRLSSHAPLHFDLSVFDLYAAAYAAAAVVLVPPRTSMFPPQVISFIRENAISIWYSVPSVLSMLTVRGGLAQGDLPSLRTVLFAGEVFPTKYLRELMRLIPEARFANLYGPTETNVCTWYDVPRLSEELSEPIPIGISVANDEVFAVTDEGKPADVGDVGELYVRGATVMRGYWGDPDRTAKVLVPDPFPATLQDLVYRTGDLVEVLPGNCYRYLGRRDTQVKSRGYRIELGDIEAAIYEHPSVVECVVLAVADELITSRLIAYLVVRDPVTERELTGFCKERLPRYMVPESFQLVSELPKTSTGKVDRRSLNALEVMDSARSSADGR